RNTASKNTSNAPKSVMAVRTMAAKPAAGPETLTWELLKKPITIPPMIPAIIPDSGGAPEASAIPIHSGNATKKTTSPDAKSLRRLAKMFTFFVIILNNLIQQFFLWSQRVQVVLNFGRRYDNGGGHGVVQKILRTQD